MKMLEIRNRDSGFFDRVYTYLDAPVEDEWTDELGSTDDLGAMMISWGTGRASHEFTVRPGAWDESFLRESVHRVADRFSRWMEEKAKTEIAPAESVAAEDSAPTLAGNRQILPLDGAWHFHYTGTRQPLDAAVLTPTDWEKWDLVRPGVGNWTKGYGNISEKNVLSSFGPDYFDYSIVGNGYYARTFTPPEGFETEGAVLSLGSIDDRCQVYVNGTLAGSTGMTEAGQPTQESTWAEYSAFPVPSGLLRSEGENTLVVRAWNDLPYGAGGWYAGPVGLYSAGAFQALMAERNNPRFREETFPSAFAAQALGQAGTVDQPYLVYLPEGYEDSTERYPSVYLLHQFNSDHTSYRMDHVDRLLDEGIAQGLYGKMIVIIPKSSEESWWTGDWERMVTEELVPYVDSNYRTIPDAGSRLTAGCSMGGQGSFGIALRHPELFSGAISFFGAFSYGGASSPNAIAASKDAAYMHQFALYFICGNQDSYGFGVPAIQLHQKLREMGVEHRFFIENGGHDSSFYLPYFQDAFQYIWQKMGR